MSKGSGRRPSSISNEKFAENWDNIFKKGYFIGFNGIGIILEGIDPVLLLGYYNTPERISELFNANSIQEYQDINDIRKYSNFVSCYYFSESSWKVGDKNQEFVPLHIIPKVWHRDEIGN